MAPKTDENKPATKHAASLKLPVTVVSLIDLGRLQRELEAVEVFLAQAAARTPGKSLALPRTTHNLEAICELNKLNLLGDEDRKQLTVFLEQVRDKAPHVHISFASDPSAAFLQRVIGWFRQSIHPLTILQVGLQPTIAAGCVLVTNSKYFDLSLRKDFNAKRPILLQRIKDTRSTATPAPSVRVEPNTVDRTALKEYGFNRPAAVVAKDQATASPGVESAIPQEPKNV